MTGADDAINKRSVLTVAAAFGGGGVAASGAIGTLAANSFTTISLATSNSTATLPSMTADGFVALTFTCGTQVLPKKATIFASGLGIDTSLAAQSGLQTQCQFSNTGSALFFWNNSLGYWIQQ